MGDETVCVIAKKRPAAFDFLNGIKGCNLSYDVYSEREATMAGVVRWIVVLLTVFTVLNAEPLEDNAASPVELTTTGQEDAIENLDDLDFQGENRGERMCKTSSISFSV